MLNEIGAQKMSHVRILKGSYRNTEIRNRVFQVAKDFKQGANGGFITVIGDTASGFPGKEIRVKVDGLRSVEPVSGNEVPNNIMNFTPSTTNENVVYEAPVDTNETDEEIMSRVGSRFEILNEMTLAAKEGAIRAMIVSGAPGVGKSYGVENTLETHSMFDKMTQVVKHEVVKGAMTPLGLYAKLFAFSQANNVLVFDDCDSILQDDLALNILKAALDSGSRRRICWNSDSSLLRREGIPDSFDFKGSVIFITNIKFDNVRSKKLKDHLDALMSRCHYLDLTIHTTREKLLRIRQIANSGGLFNQEKYGFSDEQAEEIVSFITDNASGMREISLRMALKIADLVKMSPTRWEEIARVTCMKAA